MESILNLPQAEHFIRSATAVSYTHLTMPTDSRSIVIDYNVLKQNADMGVGSTVAISLGEEQPSVSVTISGLYLSRIHI